MANVSPQALLIIQCGCGTHLRIHEEKISKEALLRLDFFPEQKALLEQNSSITRKDGEPISTLFPHVCRLI
jgi:hypothetical protein